MPVVGKGCVSQFLMVLFVYGGGVDSVTRRGWDLSSSGLVPPVSLDSAVSATPTPPPPMRMANETRMCMLPNKHLLQSGRCLVRQS